MSKMMEKLKVPVSIAWCAMTTTCLLVIAITKTNADGTVRLVNNFGSAANKGRVEVYYGDAWGTICDDDWDILDADVVCRQLGFTGALRALPRGYFGPGINLIWMDNVGCTGEEERIQDCPSSGWGSHDCLHLEDASVECSQATVRLVGGPDRLEGNVQIMEHHPHGGKDWGNVCDNGWDNRDAAVACRQLDNRQINGTFKNSHYGTGSGEFALDNVQCNGDETSLHQCPRSSTINTNCTQSRKAGASCEKDAIPDGTVRLAGSSDPSRGRVEIYHNGEWGTVCDDYWDYYDAKVVCRQLGYTNVQVKAYYKSYFGPGYGRIWLDNVACYGSESRLENCITGSGWGSHDCSHNDDAGVYCDENGEFDAAEITGIVLACIFAFSILFCCVKYICCEAASNKRNQRRRQRSRRQRRGRNTTTTTNTSTTSPDDHFDTHFNSAYTISDNHEEIFTPPGFPYPPPFPGSEPPPFSLTDLPPAYELVVQSMPVPAGAGSGVDANGVISGSAQGGVTPSDDSSQVAPPAATAGAQPLAMPCPSVATSSQVSNNQSPSMPPIENGMPPTSLKSSAAIYPPDQKFAIQVTPAPNNLSGASVAGESAT